MTKQKEQDQEQEVQEAPEPQKVYAYDGGILEAETDDGNVKIGVYVRPDGARLYVGKKHLSIDEFRAALSLRYNRRFAEVFPGAIRWEYLRSGGTDEEGRILLIRADKPGHGSSPVTVWESGRAPEA